MTAKSRSNTAQLYHTIAVYMGLLCRQIDCEQIRSRINQQLVAGYFSHEGLHCVLYTADKGINACSILQPVVDRFRYIFAHNQFAYIEERSNGPLRHYGLTVFMCMAMIFSTASSNCGHCRTCRRMSANTLTWSNVSDTKVCTQTVWGKRVIQAHTHVCTHAHTYTCTCTHTSHQWLQHCVEPKHPMDHHQPQDYR